MGGRWGLRVLCDVDVYTMPCRAGMVVCCAWIWEGRACVLVGYPGQESVGVKVRWEGDVCARLTPALPRIHVPPPPPHMDAVSCLSFCDLPVAGPWPLLYAVHHAVAACTADLSQLQEAHLAKVKHRTPGGLLCGLSTLARPTDHTTMEAT
jgi:hypothetical protein